MTALAFEALGPNVQGIPTRELSQMENITRDAQFFDVTVIGAGPAGSTIGRLLAQWGYSVLVLDKGQRRGPSLAESLPPSTRKLLGFLGILDRIDQAGFCSTSGNTVWWGQDDRRVERFSSAPGYQVLRSDFDQLLLELAENAGASIRRNATVRRVDLSADDRAGVQYEVADGRRIFVTSRFVVDCSGRAGVIAGRRFRRKEPGYSTLAIAGIWRRENGWGVEDESHTLVETYCDGWAWSVPLSSQVRYFTVMVDPRETKIASIRGLEGIYRAELSKTRQFLKILAKAELQSIPWARNASLYSADCFAGPNFLLVGDAASFIEPLSSFGVKKALASAWIGAVVVNTCCKRPAMQKAAADFFSDHESKIYTSALKQSARYFLEAAMRYRHLYWDNRAEASANAKVSEPDEAELRREPQVLAALEALKQSPRIRLRRAEGVRTEKKPFIQDRELVLQDSLLVPGMTSGVRFLDGVNLVRLVEIAGQHSQVSDLYEAYVKVCPPVGLPNFLGGLSLLLAKGILTYLR
jgi:flavin-dependent dehydrogenase